MPTKFINFQIGYEGRKAAAAGAVAVLGVGGRSLDRSLYESGD